MKKETKEKVLKAKKANVSVDENSTSTAIVTGETESKEREEQVKVAPFSDNLGREDLNQLANKVNEIIQFINEQ